MVKKKKKKKFRHFCEEEKFGSQYWKLLAPAARQSKEFNTQIEV